MVTPQDSPFAGWLGPDRLAEPARNRPGERPSLTAQAFIVRFGTATPSFPQATPQPAWSTLPNASVRLMTLELASPAEALAQAHGLLADEQRAKADSIRQPGRRAGYVLAHALLRLNLARLSDVALDRIELRYDGSGRPTMSPPVPGLCFSISYGAAACAVALAPQPIGIDVEAIRDDLDWPGIAARFFSPLERARIETCPAGQAQTEAFFETWCRKEAALKRLGKGIDAAEFIDTETTERRLAPSGVLAQGKPPMPRVAWALALSEVSGRLAPGTSGFPRRSWPGDWR